ncbi:MAG: hypothetical protein MN733_32210 [Nitrososphaera sp.]|nr:hypothetical protein [Nitrososphaera sp.]
MADDLSLLSELVAHGALGLSPRPAAGAGAPGRRQGRSPHRAILDSQTVRSADHTGETGYDAAKKTQEHAEACVYIARGIMIRRLV